MRKQYSIWFEKQSFSGIKVALIALLTFFTFNQASAQLAECKGKFLGNIMPSSWSGQIVRSDFSTYWNQVTPENAGKWGVAETSRDNYSWGDVDVMYQYCLDNDIPFKHHVFVWGSQQPDWIGALSDQEQREEVEEWYSIFAQRYPETAIIDVVNESIRNHAPEVEFKDALGGLNNGASIPYLQQNADKYGPYGTGWDYIIYAFAKAREYFPNAELVLNDYGIINDPSAIREHLEIVNILKARGLIDAVGIQCHQFNVDNMTGNQVKNNLDLLSASNLPIYVTELDITGNTEQQQRDRYADIFPVFWEHDNVKGITLWGYVEGTTWIDNTGILNADGSERAAMTWLKGYMAGLPDVCNVEGAPEVEITSPANNATFEIDANITLEANATDSDGNIAKVEFFANGTLLGTANTAPYSFDWENVAGGNYKITAKATDNEGKETTSEAITISVLGNIVIYANGSDGTEIVELIVDGNVLTTWNLNSGWGYYTFTGPSTGTFQINYTNDADGRDVQLDYLEVDGVKYEAEDQQLNTGSYGNDACGGGEYTEYMYCSGYVEFTIAGADSDNDGTPDADDACPNDPEKATNAGICGCGNVDQDIDNDDVCDTEDDFIDVDEDGIAQENDCDDTDENIGEATVWYQDLDGDGLGSSVTLEDCEQPEGFVATGGDNNDDDADNDGVITSEDCDDTDENIGLGTTWYQDTDNDGLGDAASTTTACEQPEGYVASAGDDCPNDTDKTEPGNCGCDVTEESCLDCAGIPNGDAEEDVCGTCAGGTTGLDPVMDLDACITGSSETIEIEELSVYPNPTTGLVHITGNTEWSLYNANGSFIEEGNSTRVDLSGKASGIYILKIEGKVLKVVKN